MYSATKTKNQILAIDGDLIVELKNVRVNGALFGCSGFITDPRTGKIVYINTDHNHHTVHEALYRTAKDNLDYTGGPNHFAHFDDIAKEAVAFLKKNSN